MILLLNKAIYLSTMTKGSVTLYWRFYFVIHPGGLKVMLHETIRNDEF